MKLTNLTFQRNGVHGASFYHAVISGIWSEKKAEKYIVTFETDGDKKVVIPSVRVVCVDDFDQRYRGDEIGRDVEKYLLSKLELGQTFYDLTDTL